MKAETALHNIRSPRRMHQNAAPLKFNICTLRRRHHAAGQTSLATLIQNKQNGTMEQNESIFKSSVKNREVNVNLVRILSARVRLVCIQYLSTLRRARNNFFTATCFTFEIASKIENCGSNKRVSPKARCLGGVADRKLGSRMDAPIFDFEERRFLNWFHSVNR